MQTEKISNEDTNETEEKLIDLPVTPNNAEEAKAGGLTLNYTKVTFTNVGMGSAND